jgi:hypothetical protein
MCTLFGPAFNIDFVVGSSGGGLPRRPGPKGQGAFLLLKAAVSSNFLPRTYDLEIEAALALRFHAAKIFLKNSMIFPQRRH